MAVGDFGTILRTTDGGITWKKQKSPVQHWLFDVHFSDPDTGWISAERTTILHTTDGGKNWRIQLQAQEEEVALQSISFVSDKIGWAVGEYGYIYHTKDGGETWVPQAGHFDIDEGGDLVGDVFLFSVAAVDEQTVYAVGIEGHALKSKTGVNPGASSVQTFPKTSSKRICRKSRHCYHRRRGRAFHKPG